MTSVVIYPLSAQDTTTTVFSRSVTAGEQAGLLQIWESDKAPVLGTSSSGIRQRVPVVDVQGELRRRAEQWASVLAASPGTGLQLDAAGRVFIAAGDLTAACAAFDKRLATPGLSLADRAYTLQLAVELFARGRDTAWLAVARQYLDQLNGLPLSMSVFKFKAHMSLAYANYERGDGSAASARILDALKLVGVVGFAERRTMMRSGDGRDVEYALTTLGEVWSVDTTRRGVLDSLGNDLLALAKASPVDLAADTRSHSYAVNSRHWTESIKNAMGMNALIGKPAPPLIATHWYNTQIPSGTSDAAPGARTLPVGDGRIHIVELGGLGCPSCLRALPVMERVRDSFKKQPVSVWFLSQSEQRWGATEVTPDEAAEHIYKYYVVHHGSTLPLGVWAPPVDDSTRKVGAMLARENPNFAGYNIRGVPVFVVIDGHGRVRRMIRGGGSTLETSLTRFISYLLAEAEQSSKTPPSIVARSRDVQ